jgi:hypothetical protein
MVDIVNEPDVEPIAPPPHLESRIWNFYARRIPTPGLCSSFEKSDQMERGSSSATGVPSEHRRLKEALQMVKDDEVFIWKWKRTL